MILTISSYLSEKFLESNAFSIEHKTTQKKRAKKMFPWKLNWYFSYFRLLSTVYLLQLLQFRGTSFYRQIEWPIFASGVKRILFCYYYSVNIIHVHQSSSPLTLLKVENQLVWNFLILNILDLTITNSAEQTIAHISMNLSWGLDHHGSQTMWIHANEKNPLNFDLSIRLPPKYF